MSKKLFALIHGDWKIKKNVLRHSAHYDEAHNEAIAIKDDAVARGVSITNEEHPKHQRTLETFWFEGLPFYC